MSIEKDPPNYSLENLPEELIEDILLRLRVPVKHLLQLKLVCKSWKSIISHPRFAKHHLLSSTTHHRFVSSLPGHTKIQVFSINSLVKNPSNLLKFCKNSDHSRILGSFNGILCLLDIFQNHITLFNPSTGFTSSHEILLHDQIWSTFHGFGYDHVNDKYKFLLVKNVSSETVTEIYTFGENCSVRVVENSLLCPRRNRWLGKCVNGTLNWIATQSDPHGSINQWVILSFNLATEKFSEVMLPRGKSDNICKPMLNVVHNCICVCFFDCHEDRWSVWMMKEYGVEDSWTKLMTVPHFITDEWPCFRSEICSCFQSRVCVCKGCPALVPLYLTEDGGVALLRTTTSKMFVYNSKEGSYNSFKFFGYIWSYHDSLVSPP